MKRRTLLLTALAASVTVRAQSRPPETGGSLPRGLPQPTETIDLWPDGAPGKPALPPEETVVERSTDELVSDRAVFLSLIHISEPTRH